MQSGPFLFRTSSLALSMLVIGCTPAVEDIGRLSVSGVVRWQGSTAPVEGTISLLPDASGPSAITEIVDGQYHYKNSNGPVPGKYRVVISVRKAASGAGQPDVIASKANQTEWTFSVEVPAGAETLEPFVLKSNSENNSE